MKKKVTQGGSERHRVCDPGQALTASTVAGIWHLTPADFLFSRLTATVLCIPNTHPAPFAQHASYHVTGIYHFTSCGGGGCETEGYCIISRCCCALAAFSNWLPSKSLVGQCIKQDLFEMEMLCFLHGFLLLLQEFLPQLLPPCAHSCLAHLTTASPSLHHLWSLTQALLLTLSADKQPNTDCYCENMQETIRNVMVHNQLNPQ